MDDGRTILEALEHPQAEEPEEPELVEATSSTAGDPVVAATAGSPNEARAAT
ncbi:hypothetical protein J6524_08905 [Bradyrhizobium sp. WSM 1738]|uniref:hypothetical protein n=1 Tax=Bradyrhizobium hereditatis TaxID=2821405 RepID=UPI001CE39582|nr:hypothetical protein [Bradyrhizobium hereditatis]MCA6115026.1 hypothetical protein [Bradyrhizobium hereditatis]